MILIGEIHVLEESYGGVVSPSAVRNELLDPRAPEAVRAWMTRLPAWVEILSPTAIPDFAQVRLDKGEREAIALALELDADQLIVDEMRGRREAKRFGLKVIGTLGILEESASQGLLDLRLALERLRQTNFHISDAVLAEILRRGSHESG